MLVLEELGLSDQAHSLALDLIEEENKRRVLVKLGKDSVRKTWLARKLTQLGLPMEHVFIA